MFCTFDGNERFLDSVGAKYHYTNDMIWKKLIANWDKTNLGRSMAVIRGAVDEYFKLMEQGSPAPAPILWNGPDGFEVLDGIQRLLAERQRGVTKFSAYVVESDSSLLVATIRIIANHRLHGGYQETSEWTLEQAIEVLVMQHGMSLEDLADTTSWSLTTIRYKWEAVKMRHAIRSVGGPESMPDTMCRTIGKFANLKDFDAAPLPISHFTNDLAKMKLSAAEAEPYVEAFFDVPRERKNLHVQFDRRLTEFREDEDVALRLSDPRRKWYQNTTPEGKLMKALRGALTVAENVRDTEDGVNCTDEAFQIINQTRKVVQQIHRSARKNK